MLKLRIVFYENTNTPRSDFQPFKITPITNKQEDITIVLDTSRSLFNYFYVFPIV